MESEMGQGERREMLPPLKWREYTLTVPRAREEMPALDDQL